MSRRHYNLPPLTTLSAFETAARHLSFKSAAQELSVTPGAVSHQIKALEGELGRLLFLRRHRGVELTQEGQDLYDALAGSFGKISQSIQRIREAPNGDRVTIGSTTAVASLWLSGSLIRFWRSFPDQDVTHVAQDRMFQNRDDFDLYIRYGRDPRDDLDQIPLYRDHLLPVASPDEARQLSGRSLQELAAQRLIVLDSEDRSWTTWTDWFRDLGYHGPIRDGLHVNRYSVALQVAQDGAGLALGWQRLIAPLLETGKLMTIGPHVLTAPHRFYLVCRPDPDLSDRARALRDWILGEMQGAA